MPLSAPSQYPKHSFTPQEHTAFIEGVAAFESKNFSQAMALLSALAEKGNEQAQHMLALMYQNGLGITASDRRAFYWMQHSAQQGYALAQHGLGFMYMEGICTEQDGTKAVEWFHKAAQQGMQGSLTTLAMMYEQGRGVKKDPQKAKDLYQQAGFNKNI